MLKLRLPVFFLPLRFLFPPLAIRLSTVSDPLRRSLHAGGAPDVVMRLVGITWRSVKIRPLVENRVGAAAVIGSQWSRPAPDGRTFARGAERFGVRSAIDRTVPYDIRRTSPAWRRWPLCRASWSCRPRMASSRSKDLIAYAKAQPQGVHYSSGASVAPRTCTPPPSRSSLASRLSTSRSAARQKR